MEIIPAERLAEIKREKSFLEDKLKVTIKPRKKAVEIDGDPLDEYEASIVIEAIGFGFPARLAIMIKEEDILFRKLNIKDFSRRKNMKEVRSRVIGTRRSTLDTIEEISGCKIRLKNNELGIIGNAEDIETAIQGLINLVRGSKQSNVYRFLERNK